MHKFRVWDRNTKTMEGYMDGYFTLEDFMNGSFPKCFLDKWNRVRKDLVFLQWTGFKDRNGREIYEGDIISITGTDAMYSRSDGIGTWEVTFFEGSFFGTANNGTSTLGSQGLQHTKVIGNIYEDSN